MRRLFGFAAVSSKPPYRWGSGSGSAAGAPPRHAASACAVAVAFAAVASFASDEVVLRDDFADATHWKVANFKNRLTVKFGAGFENGTGVTLGGGTSKCDTAWNICSRKIAIPPGKSSYRVTYKTTSDVIARGDTVPSGAYSSAIFWYGADGSELSAAGFPAVIPTGRERRIAVTGPIPKGAVAAVVRFGADAPNIDPGEKTVIGEFAMSAGESPLATTDAELLNGTSACDSDYDAAKVAAVETFPTNRAAGISAALRDDGIALVNGKPFFPIGIYSVCKREFNGQNFDKAFKDLAKAGFNFAHTYGNAYEKGFFEAARKHGFLLWVAARMPNANFLEKGRFEPSVLAWYLGDDTSDHITAFDERTYDRACKRADPHRLTCQADGVKCGGFYSNFSDYVTATDVFMPEIYPVRFVEEGQPATNCVASVIRCMKRWKRDIAICGDGKPRACWPILQAFRGWTTWKRFPTREELFATAFAAIVHGAHGITWYTYGGFWAPKLNDYNEGIASTRERWNTMSELAGFIRELSPALLERTGAQPPPAKILSGPEKDGEGNVSVSCLLKRTDAETYLIAVNSVMSEVRAQVSLRDVPVTGEVLRENREILLTDGVLEDTFQPFEVHVYRFKK